MWYEHVSRWYEHVHVSRWYENGWYENGWYEKTLVRKTLLPFLDFCYNYSLQVFSFNSYWLWIVRSQVPGLNILFIVSFRWATNLFRAPTTSFNSCNTTSFISLYYNFISLEWYIVMMYPSLNDIYRHCDILLDQYIVMNPSCTVRDITAVIFHKNNISARYTCKKGSNNISLNYCCNALLIIMCVVDTSQEQSMIFNKYRLHYFLKILYLVGFMYYLRPVTIFTFGTHLTTAPVKVIVRTPYLEEKNRGLSW